MNSKTAKKVRKYSRRNWLQYFHTMREWPFGVRLRFCWQLMFGMRARPTKKLSKSKVLQHRKPIVQGAK